MDERVALRAILVDINNTKGAVMTNANPRLLLERLCAISQHADSNDLVDFDPYPDRDTGRLRGKFEGAIMNLAENGEATAARTGIWATCVREHIVQGMQAIKAGKEEDGFLLLVRAANSLAAYAEAQSYLDPFDWNRSL